jgi:precorrin-6A/cobalt-precorrin-6A reductase
VSGGTLAARILLLGGTADARDVARALREAGYRVVLTAVSAYAGALATADADVRVGALDAATLDALLADADWLLDATHPFATAISALAMARAAARGVPYVRFERPEALLSAPVHRAPDAATAATLAADLAPGGMVLLTVGSKSLATYVSTLRARGCRLLARVLPTAAVLAHCEALGLSPAELLAMQGPVSAPLELAIIRHFAAGVLVTKESGPTGGVPEKLEAAATAGIPVVVVTRPPLVYPRVVRTVGEVLEEVALQAREAPGAHPRIL